MFQFLPGGRLHVTDTWIKFVIQQAYDLEDYQVIGGPSWLSSDSRYDIEAKAPGDATKDQMRLMLQTLLAERCELKTHRETREFAVLNLAVAKGGPHLTSLKPGEQSKCNRDNSEICGLQTMAQLANFLRANGGHPVFDKTGIQGNYDILLNFDVFELSGRPAPPGYDKPSLATALEQLGLRLVPAKAQIPVLVIDSIQRPSDN